MTRSSNTNAPGTSRQRLIEAARDILWERGYIGMSPAAVLHRANVGQGSMYHYFTGKHALATAAMEQNLLEADTLRDADLEAPGGWYRRVVAFMRRQREPLRGCKIGRMAYDPEVYADDLLRQPVGELFAGTTEKMSTLLRQGIDAGDLPPDIDTEEIGTALIAVIEGGYVLARAAKSAEPFERSITGALAMIDALTQSAVSATPFGANRSESSTRATRTFNNKEQP